MRKIVAMAGFLLFLDAGCQIIWVQQLREKRYKRELACLSS
jgi:hypothetical protein